MGFRDSLKKQQQATQLFTDREEPRAAFWKQYNQAHWQLKEGSDNPMVLTYYGVGGIGKSSLLKQLIVEMDAKPRPPKYIYFDFTNAQDSYTVMKRLRNKLAQDHGFQFRLFDAGCYLYATAIGVKEDAPEAKQLTDKHKALNIAMTVLSEVPGLSLVSKVFSYADKAGAMIQTYRMNHQSEMADRESADPAQMLRQLTLLFSMDLNRQMQKAEEPLVILLDTYEKLHNDQWLHSTSLHPDCKNSDEPFCEGIIPNIPNTLWVIAGREKLKWAEYDQEWNAVLSQHILGDLSQADSDYYLKNAGVEPEQLRTQLHNLTHGTPVYLALCVKQYYTYLSNGINPTIEDFGSTPKELVERFALYMDDNQKIVVYILSCLQTWDDELLLSFAPRALPSYNPETYDKKIKHLSFIIESDDDQYNIHQTVGEVLLQDAPKIIRRQIAQTMVDYFTEQLALLIPGDERFARSLDYLLRAGALLYQDRDEYRIFYVEKIRPHMVRLEDFGYLTHAEAFLDKLEQIASQNRVDALFAMFLTEKSWLFYKLRADEYSIFALATHAFVQYTVTLGPNHEETLYAADKLSAVLWRRDLVSEALTMNRRIFEQYKRLYGERDPRTMGQARNIVVNLNTLKKYDDALPMAQWVLAVQKEELPADDMRIALSLSDLAFIYDGMQWQADAIKLFRQSLDMRLKYYGVDNVDTAAAMSQLAYALEKQKAYEEALSLRQQAQEIRQNIFGEAHPDTVRAMRMTARTLEKLNRYEEALPLRRQVLELEKFTTTGWSASDSHVHAARKALSHTLQVLGQEEEAQKLLEENKPKHDPKSMSLGDIFAVSMQEHAEESSYQRRRKKSFRSTGLQTAFDSTFGERYAPLHNFIPDPLHWSVDDIINIRAEKLFQTKSEHGEAHPQTMKETLDFLFFLQDHKFRTYAEDLGMHLICQYRGRYGMDTPQSMVGEISVLNVLKKKQEAIDLQTKLLQLYRTQWGVGHTRTANAACTLSDMLLRSRQADLAVTVLQEQLQLCRQTNGNTHENTANVMHWLCRAYRDVHKTAEAAALGEALLRVCRSLYGKEHQKTQTVLKNLYRDYRSLGQHARADELLREIL